MNTFNFSITGTENISVNASPEVMDEQEIRKAIQDQLHVPEEDEFDIYDQQNNLVHNLKTTLLSKESKGIFRICILNKLSQENLVMLPKEVSEDSTFKDTVSRKRYVCVSAKCRKTYDSCSDLFEHYKAHFLDKPFKCPAPR